MFVFSPDLRDLFHTSMVQYSLLVLKLPLNTNQLTNSLVGINIKIGIAVFLLDGKIHIQCFDTVG